MTSRHLSILLLLLLMGGIVLAGGVLIAGPSSVEDQTVELYQVNQELHAEQGAVRIWQMLRDVEVRLATSANHQWAWLDEAKSHEDLQYALTRLGHRSDEEFGITLAVLDQKGQVLAVEPEASPERAQQIRAHVHGAPPLGPDASFAACRRCLSEYSSLLVTTPMDRERILAASINLDRLASRIFEQVSRSRSTYIALVDADNRVIFSAGNHEERAEGDWVVGRAPVPDTELTLELAAPRSVVAPEVRARVSTLLLTTSGILGFLLACIGVLVVLKRREHREHLTQVRSLAHQDKLATLGMMAASTAHEIRNAIAVARLQLEVAASVDDADQKDLTIEKAVGAVERLADLAENLSGYAGKSDQAAERFEVSAVIEEALGVVEPKIGRRVEVDVDAEDALFVHGSSAALVQVIVNLVLNALDALEGRSDDPRVQVRARRDGDDAIIAVIDNGEGIEPSALDNIFKPFFSTKDDDGSNGGTGIGLWLCSQILEQHNGSIHAENIDDGGARFMVRIPVDVAPASSPREEPTGASAARDDEGASASLESA